MTYDIRNNEQESRFETTVDGHVAYATYELESGRIAFTHTTVPDELAGKGIGNQLAQAGLEYARSEKLRVAPRCSFFAAYIRRHPEYEELVTT